MKRDLKREVKRERENLSTIKDGGCKGLCAKGSIDGHPQFFVNVDLIGRIGLNKGGINVVRAIGQKIG